MQEKRIGYGLLATGLIVMLVSFLLVVMLFVGITEPVKLFNIAAPSLDTSTLIPDVPGLPSPKGEKIEILPTETFSKVLNMGIQFLLMTFVMSFGFKLAELGIKLLRPIKIEAKN